MSITYSTFPQVSELWSTEEADCSWGLAWQDLTSRGGRADVEPLVPFLFRVLCLQGAAVNETPSTLEGLSLHGAVETWLSVSSCLPCIAASPQPPPFCSWLNGASIWLSSVLLHSEPPERLFFRIPLKPGSESWCCRSCWSGLCSSDLVSVSGLDWVRRTSLGFRLTDKACCLSERSEDKRKAGSSTGPFWSWTGMENQINSYFMCLRLRKV